MNDGSICCTQPDLSLLFSFYKVGGAVLSAPPTINPTSVESVPTSTGTTIEAKPQIKNLIGDATRFVPTSLKVRRTVKDAHGRLIKVGGGISSTGNRSGGGFGLSSSRKFSVTPYFVILKLILML